MLPSEVRNAIREVVAYNYPDELRDFEECQRNGDGVDNHILLALDTLAEYLEDTEGTTYHVQVGTHPDLRIFDNPEDAIARAKKFRKRLHPGIIVQVRGSDESCLYIGGTP